MSPLKRLPRSIRYFIARLRPWTQPVVWVPCIVLGVGGLFIWEVAVHPEWLNSEEEEWAEANNRDRNAELSLEDQAIAAEIDTVPVLVNQLKRSNPGANFLNRSVIRTKGLFDEVREGGLETPGPSPAPKGSANSFLTPNNPDTTETPIALGTNPSPSNSAPVANTATVADLLIRAQALNLEATNVPSAGNANLLNPPTKLKTNPSTASPLQLAMEKYLATQSLSNATAPQTPSRANAQIATQANPQPEGPPLLPPFGQVPEQTTRAFVNPLAAQQPANLDPTSNLTSQQPIGSTAPTHPDPSNGLSPNSALPTRSATPTLPSNPYQTNLSGSGFAPTGPSLAPTSPTVTPSPQLPTTAYPFGSSPYPATSQGSKIDSGYSPNEANAAYQFMQSNPSYVTSPPSYGTPSQIDRSVTQPNLQPLQPAPFSAPNPVPGRYIGGGQIDTFANP